MKKLFLLAILFSLPTFAADVEVLVQNFTHGCRNPKGLVAKVALKSKIYNVPNEALVSATLRKAKLDRGEGPRREWIHHRIISAVQSVGGRNSFESDVLLVNPRSGEKIDHLQFFFTVVPLPATGSNDYIEGGSSSPYGIYQARLKLPENKVGCIPARGEPTRGRSFRPEKVTLQRIDRYQNF